MRPAKLLAMPISRRAFAGAAAIGASLGGEWLRAARTPPKLVVWILLGVFYLIELLVWIPLQLTAAIKTRAGKPSRKQVNVPNFSWRL